MVQYYSCLITHNILPPVAKLDIAADSDSEGRGFESLRAGQQKRTFVYQDKGSLFVYPSRRLGISSPHEVWCISPKSRLRSAFWYIITL